MEELMIPDSAPVLSSDQLIMVADQAEKRVVAVNKIKTLALRVTNPNDWVDQGNKPYLQASGAQKVARLFGISWRIGEPSYEQQEDGHFTYTYQGEFMMSGGVTTTSIGTRSSKDPFFSKNKPISEIDKPDIMKSAYTNCIGNGITALLGIKNLTWDEVKAGGVDYSQTNKVDYKKKSDGKASENQLKRMWTRVYSAATKRGLEKDVAEDEIRLYISENFKLETTKDLTGDQADKVGNWVESMVSSESS